MNKSRLEAFSDGVIAILITIMVLENWEQGRARPNPQAALLISLVKKFPDLVGGAARERLSETLK
jgi:DNA-binding transcriptional regulator YiaG